jgi:hypothetical protein
MRHPNRTYTILLVISFLFPFVLAAQTDTARMPLQKALETIKPQAVTQKAHWYDKIQLRGYTQVRYNRLLETNSDLKFEGDRSVGDKGGLLIRRGRLIFFGDISSHLFLYYQVDFASNASSTSLHFGQVRDLYADIFVDTGKVFRFRVGQSKVPFGFENMQSSQNRLSLDRADALNTAVPSERDLGAFFYWTPRKARYRYDYLGEQGLKGSNNYGVFGFGVYNGQSTNKPELNNSLHVVGRLSYPFGFGKQILEIGVQGYTGFFTLESGQASSGVKKNATSTYRDKRFAASIALAPQPFGILAEYNIGESPMYRVDSDSILNTPLEGGFVTLFYKTKLPTGQTIIPFVRAQYYSGGVKIATDTKALKMNEYDFGIEYQIMKSLEIATTYTYSIRNTSDKAKEFNNQTGSLLRIQVQFNY